MNVHSLSNQSPQFSGTSAHDDSRKLASRLSFKIPYLRPTLPDDATSVGPDMAPVLVRQLAVDWVAHQTARWK
jgi:hypothetical protein